MNYVTLEEAKKYLRISHDKDDKLINEIIISAQTIIENYLNFKLSKFNKIPEDLKIALYMYIANLYDNRGSINFSQDALMILNKYIKIRI